MPTTPLPWLVAAACIPLLPAQTQFVVRTPPAVTTALLTDAVAADFDGDGDIDLCGAASFLAGSPRQRMLRNEGGERFVDVTATSLPTLPPIATTLQRTGAIDIEHDGDVDLVIFTIGVSALWRNNGNGTFVDASVNLPPNPSGFNDVFVADLDGDGDDDIAAAGQALAGSSNMVFVNQGNGVFTAISPFPGTTGIAIEGADLDQDGDVDLLLGTLAGLTVLRNDGAMVFTDVTATWAPGLLPGTVRDVVAGDLDGDGLPDLVVARQGVALDAIVHDTGASLVISGTLPTVANGSNRLLLVDADEDGDRDIVRAAGGGFIDLAVNNGLGVFVLAPSRMPTVASQAPGLLVADFDGDGDPDVLACEPILPPTLLMNRHRDLRPGQPVIGQPWNVEIWSKPGYAAQAHLARLAVAVAALPQPLVLPGLGALRLDLAAGFVYFDGIVSPAPGKSTFPFVVPPAPVLIGLPLHLQGLVEQTPGPARLTAWFRVTVQ